MSVSAKAPVSVKSNKLCLIALKLCSLPMPANADWSADMHWYITAQAAGQVSVTPKSA